MQSNYIVGVRIWDYVIQERRRCVEDALFTILTLVEEDNILKQGGKTCSFSSIREDNGSHASISVEIKEKETILLFLVFV
jgi:hypothetical protein